MRADARTSPLWILALLLALVPVGHLLATNAVLLQHDVFLSDYLHAAVPLRAYLGEALADGRLPLWIPDIFAGTPFLSTIESGALYWPDWPLYAAFDPNTASNLSIAATLLIGAAGAHVLARVHGASVPAAAFCGLVFATCGFSLSHLKHVQMHHSAVWLPWALAALDAGLAGRRHWLAALPLVLSLQAFAGHPQILYISCLTLLVRGLSWLAGAWAAGDRPEVMRTVLASAVAACLSVGAMAVLLLPVLRFSRASAMRSGSLDWEQATVLSFFPPDLLHFLAPRLRGSKYALDYLGTLQWENNGYVGLLGLALSVLGATMAHRSGVRFHRVVVLVAILLALGPWTPLYRIAWEIVPGMATFRFPQRFLLVADVSLALLAAHGFDVVLDGLSSRGSRFVAGFAAVLLGAHTLDVTFSMRPQIPVEPAADWAIGEPSPHVAAAAGGRALTLHAWDVWEETYVSALPSAPHVPSYSSHARVPLGSSGVLLGLRSIDGYVALVRDTTGEYLAEYNHELMRAVRQVPKTVDGEHGGVTLDPRYRTLLRRAGVTLLFARDELRDDGLTAIGREGAYSVYRVDGALPRAYVASAWSATPDDDAMAEQVYGGAAAVPVVFDAAGLPPGPGGASEVVPVGVEEAGDRTLFVDVAGAGAGLLVLTDAYDPDWRASIDGQPTEVLRVNGFQRGIRLPEGARQVRFEYWPAGLTQGLAVSAASALLTVVFAAALRRGRT